MALFTNVPAHETIRILAEETFAENWFNNTYNLNLNKDQLIELLKQFSVLKKVERSSTA